MQSELIYLACPFRHSDVSIQKKRLAAAHFVTAMLIAQKRHVFSPLTHNSILIDILEDRLPPLQWLEFDLNILERCDRLLVLKMEGWELSKGVQREIHFARERGIPVEEIDPPAEVL